MSKEDKLQAMQDLMMESKDIWTLKDLERDCPKKKGINAMSVKEVLQELCDNDLVSFEKIGSGNFYWCFPSQAYNRRKVVENRLTKNINDIEAEIKSLEAEIAELEPGREDCDERTKLDKEVEEFSQKISSVKHEAAKYEKLNPAGIREKQEQTKIAFDAANRWTDNIFSLSSWVEKKLGKPKSDFYKIFEISEDFDYIE